MKLTYDDIKLSGKVKNTCSDKSPNYIGEITCIDNAATLAGITEPLFHVKFRDYDQWFGLKYILKHYIQTN